MRKKRNLLLVALILVLGATLTLMLTNRQKMSSRSTYEQFLRNEYAQFPKFSNNNENESELKEMDRPDMAALDEYTKTVDPKLKVVPRERMIPAYLTTEALQRQKSGGSELSWTDHPTDMGGRTRTIMFDPNDPTHSRVWAGSVTGGLWKNEDPFHDMPWEPVNDFWPDLAISCMAYDPNSTQDLYIGTGESQTAVIIYRESSGKGTGIMHSSDGGITWSIMQSTTHWAYVNDIVIRDEAGTSVMYVAVASGIYKGLGHSSQPSDGLFRSTDGGNTWTQVLPEIPGTGKFYCPSDIILTSDNSRIFVGTTYGIKEDISDNDRSGAGCILWSDDGLTWNLNDTYHNRILNGNNYPGRVMLCNAPSDPSTVLAVVAAADTVRYKPFVSYQCEFLLKSTDKGESWSELNFPGGFAYLAWHAFVVQVNPSDPNEIWVGGLDTHRSKNGGTNWTKMSNWALMYGSQNGDYSTYVHADIHRLVFQPGSSDAMIVGTDGGIFGTVDARESQPTFQELAKGFSTLQYYSGAIHPAAGSNHILGGLQDNGTMSYRNGHTPTFLDMLSGGDGALCFIDENEPTIQITTVYYNSLHLYTGPQETKPSSRNGKNLSTGIFINPMDYNWRDNILFANGMDNEGFNGNTLEVVNVTSTRLNAQARKNLNTNSEVPYSNIKWSEHSPENTSTLFIGTQAGNIFRIGNAMATTIDAQGITDLTPDEFPTANISCIDVAQSEDTLLVTFSNYGVPSVWLTVDGGATWKDVEGNLPDMPVRWGIFHQKNGYQVMLATETGIWTTLDITAKEVVWTPDVEGMANVRTDMLKFRKSDNTVLAATHGRGMFTATWDTNYSSGVHHDILHGEDINVFPNPTDEKFTVAINALGKYRITVLDITGKIVSDESNEHVGLVRKNFDLSDQPRGTYLVRVLTEGQMTTRKVLVY